MDTLKRVNKWELKGTSNLQHIINVARHNDSEVMIWDEELGTFTEIYNLVDMAFTGMYSDNICDVTYHEHLNSYYITNIRSRPDA